MVPSLDEILNKSRLDILEFILNIKFLVLSLLKMYIIPDMIKRRDFFSHVKHCNDSKVSKNFGFNILFDGIDFFYLIFQVYF